MTNFDAPLSVRGEIIKKNEEKNKMKKSLIIILIFWIGEGVRLMQNNDYTPEWQTEWLSELQTDL